MVVVAQLVTQAADAAAGRHVTSADPTARDMAMLVDKRRLERVFANLVENAERHGRGCLAVRVSMIEEGVQVLVDDAGPGSPPNVGIESSSGSPGRETRPVREQAWAWGWRSLSATSNGMAAQAW
jgi:C4-dicarboxylate-specific signal transduction histidine kinase